MSFYDNIIDFDDNISDNIVELHQQLAISDLNSKSTSSRSQSSGVIATELVSQLPTTTRHTSGPRSGHTLQVIQEQLSLERPYIDNEPVNEPVNGPVPDFQQIAEAIQRPSNRMELAEDSDNGTNIESQRVGNVSSELQNSPITPASWSNSIGSHERVQISNSTSIHSTSPSSCTEEIVTNNDVTQSHHQPRPCSPYLCRRCCKEQVNTMLRPCCHVGLCMECANHIVRYTSSLVRRCPFCGKYVEGVESVQLA